MKLLPIAQRWGGGPFAEARMVEGFSDPDGPSTTEQKLGGPPPHALRAQGGAKS
jgi:hypothetical protein